MSVSFHDAAKRNPGMKLQLSTERVKALIHHIHVRKPETYFHFRPIVDMWVSALLRWVIVHRNLEPH